MARKKALPKKEEPVDNGLYYFTKRGYNAEDPRCFEPPNTLKSLVEPGQAMTVKEIFARFRRGQTVQVLTGEYDFFSPDQESYDLVDISKLDRADRELFVKNAENRLNELKDLLVEQDKAAKAATEEAEVEIIEDDPEEAS